MICQISKHHPITSIYQKRVANKKLLHRIITGAALSVLRHAGPTFAFERITNRERNASRASANVRIPVHL